MRLLFITAFLFINSFCFSQRRNIYLLKNNGEYVMARDSADYIRVVSEPDSGSTLYNFAEYYMNGKTKRLGLSSVIDPPKLEGVCTEFYKNGKRQSVTDYKNGSALGLEYDYYPNGKLYQVKNFTMANNAKGDFDDNRIIDEYDSTGTALVIDSNGYYKGFDNKFKKIVEEGRVKNGSKDGSWTGYNDGLSITFKEMYVDGKLVSGVSFSKTGDSVMYFKSRNVEPKFKNDTKAFIEFLSRNIRYPDYDRAHDIEGRVILTFVVEGRQPVKY
jgi:antitoxin component YwqK of YwqJK toxin-antitoxin module